MEGMTYNELSQGLNNHLGNDQLFTMSGLTMLIIFVLTCGGAVLAFRWYGAREEEAQRNSYKEYKERQAKVARSSRGQHNRKWFRLKTEAKFKWILKAQAETAKDKDYKNDHLVDISGDGLCFTTAESLNIDDEILFFLDTDEGKNLALTGRAVRIVEETGEDIIMYSISVKFGNLRAGDRDRVVAWILKRQRATIREEDPDNVSLPPTHTFDVNGE